MGDSDSKVTSLSDQVNSITNKQAGKSSNTSPTAFEVTEQRSSGSEMGQVMGEGKEALEPGDE